MCLLPTKPGLDSNFSCMNLKRCYFHGKMRPCVMELSIHSAHVDKFMSVSMDRFGYCNIKNQSLLGSSDRQDACSGAQVVTLISGLQLVYVNSKVNHRSDRKTMNMLVWRKLVSTRLFRAGLFLNSELRDPWKHPSRTQHHCATAPRWASTVHEGLPCRACFNGDTTEAQQG